VKLPPPQNVFGTLFPLAMTLVQDPVAEVRRESFKGVARMLRVLEPGYVPVYPVEEGEDPPAPLSEADGNNYLDSVSRAINALVHGETYHHRQLWANLCLQLITELPRDLFEKYFIQGILLLTSDSVCNVRVSLAEMLVGWEPNFPAPWEVEDSAQCPWKWLMERSDIRECIARLARDDNDVFINVSRLQPLFPDLKFEAIRCVGLKRAPGGVVPVGKGSAGKPRGADGDGDSSDSSVGADRRSPCSSISSADAAGKEESYDNFLPEEQTLPPLVLSSPGHAMRRFTPSPTTGVLSPEDIIVTADEDGADLSPAFSSSHHAYHHRTPEEELMDDKWPEPVVATETEEEDGGAMQSDDAEAASEDEESDAAEEPIATTDDHEATEVGALLDNEAPGASTEEPTHAIENEETTTDASIPAEVDETVAGEEANSSDVEDGSSESSTAAAVEVNELVEREEVDTPVGNADQEEQEEGVNDDTN
jgi:hypothetical protein